jgi:hypothetical protein
MSLLALGLLKFVPDIIDLFSSKNKKKEVIELVSNLAKQVTGESTVDEAEHALSADPELAFEFKMAVMENETILERMDEESRQRASGQYKVHNVQADKIAESIMARNLVIIFVLVLINVVAVFTTSYFKLDDPATIAIISNLIGVVIGQLLAERQTVVSFFFGSSMGSKIKSIMAKED